MGTEAGWELQHLRVEVGTSGLIYEVPCNLWVTSKKDSKRAYHRITVTRAHLVTAALPEMPAPDEG